MTQFLEIFRLNSKGKNTLARTFDSVAFLLEVLLAVGLHLGISNPHREVVNKTWKMRTRPVSVENRNILKNTISIPMIFVVLKNSIVA